MTSLRLADDASQSPATRAERVALATTTIFLLVAPFAASGGLRATCLIVAALALVAARPWRELSSGRPLPRALIAAFASWSVLALASLAWSADPLHTWEELRAETLYSTLAFGVFFLAATSPDRWRQWWIALIAGTLLTFAASALQQGSGIVLWRHSPDGGIGPFSTHLVLVAPLLVALVSPAPWGLRRSVPALAGALATLVAAAWLTRNAWTPPNRIVWPSLLAVFGVAVLAGRRAAGFKLDDLPGLRPTIALGAILIVIAFLAAIAAKNERFYPNDPSGLSSLERDLRPRLWSVAWNEWKAAPWLGHGFGREIRASAFLPETPPIIGHPPVRHGHNLLLNIALQLGIAGVGLFAAVLVLLAREYARFLAEPAIAPLGVIGLALLAGFLAKNLTDDFLHRHNAQVFWALNAMLLGLAQRVRR